MLNDKKNARNIEQISKRVDQYIESKEGEKVVNKAIRHSAVRMTIEEHELVNLSTIPT